MPFYEVSIAYDVAGDQQKSKPYKTVNVETREVISVVLAKALQWAGFDHMPKLITVRQYDQNKVQVDEVAQYRHN